ncbi:PRADC1-like protein [Planococcus citri]|uniref:PRADC1-like protein n=1 Tax=Planococcus citri TaxID=170843 RepID=UPI0031FA3E53
MILNYLLKIFQILIVLFVYTSALFDHIDVVNLFDYESDVFFEILEPEELRYTYRVRPATNFGVPLNDTIEMFSTKLVPTEPPFCCSPPENAFQLMGNIALVERGKCTFKKKAIHAEEAGAVGIIITDYDYNSDVYIDMLDDESVRQTSISAAFLLGKNGFVIRSTLKKLNLEYAEINIPLNLTKIGVHKKRQPPWLLW